MKYDCRSRLSRPYWSLFVRIDAQGEVEADNVREQNAPGELEIDDAQICAVVKHNLNI